MEPRLADTALRDVRPAADDGDSSAGKPLAVPRGRSSSPLNWQGAQLRLLQKEINLLKQEVQALKSRHGDDDDGAGIVGVGLPEVRPGVHGAEEGGLPEVHAELQGVRPEVHGAEEGGLPEVHAELPLLFNLFNDDDEEAEEDGETLLAKVQGLACRALALQVRDRLDELAALCAEEEESEAERVLEITHYVETFPMDVDEDVVIRAALALGKLEAVGAFFDSIVDWCLPHTFDFVLNHPVAEEDLDEVELVGPGVLEVLLDAPIFGPIFEKRYGG